VFFFGFFSGNDSRCCIEVEKNSYQEKEPYKKLIRIENSIFFFRKKKVQSIFGDFSFFPQNFLNNLFEKNKFFFFFYLETENIDQMRKRIMEKLFLKNNKMRNNEIKNSKIFIIVPNQTSMFQLIRILFFSKEKGKLHKKFFSKNLFNSDFLNIKFGKIIKPADFKRNFLDGQEDYIRLNCLLRKNKISFGKEGKADFLFLTPIFLRTLNKKSLAALFKSSFSYLIDNFQLIYMQNSENSSMIIKSFFLSYKFKDKNKNIILKKPFQTKLIEVFILSNFFQSNFLFLKKSSCFYKIFLKKGRKWKNQTLHSKVKNWVLFFNWNKKISKIQNLLLIFEKNFAKILPKKALEGVLIFCQDYSEFIFIRNYLWKNIREGDICLVMLHEYLNNFEKNRRKNSSKNSNKKIILITERFYFFNRFPILNVETVFFFSRPKEIEYFFEICKFFKENKKIKNIFSIQENFLKKFQNKQNVKK